MGAGSGLIPARAGKTLPLLDSMAARTAHPRACGENVGGAVQAVAAVGSSPRVRGKPDDWCPRCGDLRLIPARAGKTVSHLDLPGPLRAHPRACGENIAGSAARYGQPGSSPRVRGKRDVVGGQDEPLGLIPARAGKTDGQPGRIKKGSAHPRACGENHLTKRLSVKPLGSSPRVRGKPDGKVLARGDVRLIPARAGKTRLSRRLGLLTGAHPRACGENFNGKAFLVNGSGLIPARAGKTVTYIFQIRLMTAHPRACGENAPMEGLEPSTAGSSPRVRGKRRAAASSTCPPRLIPARAGKTPVHRHRDIQPRAHPRACGENDRTYTVKAGSNGSSPRVRGKRAGCTAPPGASGLIPARAGKTVPRSGARIRSGAHPRACGENPVGRSTAARWAGSSPRVRGKPPTFVTATALFRAHPRACGENLMTQSVATMPQGSSPRVRGKPPWQLEDLSVPGLIPARAGKTADQVEAPVVVLAHPRACGENGLFAFEGVEVV